MIRYVLALAAIATLSLFAVAEDIKATAEQKAEFTAKVAAVAMSKAETIPAKSLDKVRIVTVQIQFGADPEETRVFVAWEKGAVADGKFVPQTNDNATLPFADVKDVDVAKFVDAVTAILKAKGKF